MACLLAGGLLMLGRRELAGGAALAAAVAIKASAGLLAPAIALGTVRRGRALIGLAGGALLLLVASVVAFGPHLPDLRDQARLVNAYSVPSLVGYAMGHGGADAEVRRRFALAALLGGAVCAGVAWRIRRWESPAGWAGLISLACVSWVMSWYVLWALPFAALSRSRVLRGATLAFSVWLVLIWAGTVPTYLRAQGYHPRATATGRANAHFTGSLLHPCSLHLGKHRMLPRLDGLAVRSAARHASARVAARRCLSRRRARVRGPRRRARRVDPHVTRRRPHRHRAGALRGV
jgi:peptidoglycan/LPS O-acetylase OafA/YrhL